jgi:hypothetical protein
MMAQRARRRAAETEPTDTPPIGHNLPPHPQPSLTLTAEQWIGWMAHVFEEATKRRADLLASFQRFSQGYPLTPGADGDPPHGIEKWSEEIQGKAGDLRNKVRLLLGNAEATHRIEKEPVLAATRAIDGYMRSFRAPLDDAMREITRRQTVFAKWLDHESRARAREEAKRISEEADAALQRAATTLDPDDLQQAADSAADATASARFAAAKPAEHTRVHGELGSVTSLRTTTVFMPHESDIFELAKAVVLGQAPASYLAFNDTRIRLAIRVEGVRHIPGCVIREEMVAR